MFRKIRFTSKHGATAGLVVPAAVAKKPITEISRLFPMHEASKMERFEQSPVLPSWEAAFNFSFEGGCR